ncbi:MAG: (2Fe-2S) ferredoxin domain-containing protein [Planktothrix sp.]|uniref:(2Fe-2S) ferredoxin domain-containing protein n=1 Tax=Planktothrix sp. TaxID=3088171 RepID=UPI0038D464E6
MFKSHKNDPEFNLEGTIQNVWIKKGKPKFISLLTPLGLFLIKVSKEAVLIGISALAPGYEVKVTGQKKQDLKTGKIKLKADRVISISPPISTLTLSLYKPVQYSYSDTDKKCSVPTAKILICQKSDCRKRGGDAVCKVLQQELVQRGLEEQVTIEKTGCLKKCKSGPNLVILPDKTRYSKVEPEAIPVLIEQHLAGNREEKSTSV